MGREKAEDKQLVQVLDWDLGLGSNWENERSPSSSPSPWGGLRGSGAGKGAHPDIPSGICSSLWGQGQENGVQPCVPNGICSSSWDGLRPLPWMG